MQPYGKNLATFRGPKVSKGERREAGIRWIQPPKAVSDSEFRQTTSGAHGSANRADCLPRGKPFGAPAGAGLFPCRGTDAPTPARVMGLAALWGAHTFLSMAKEKCAKESQRHGATGKRLLLPILTAGLAMSRAMELDSYHTGAERARARLFPPSKWAGLFPSAAYRRSAPPQLALSRLKRRCLGCFDVAEMALHRKPADLVFALRLV